ncbi:putative short chain dehydrogenase [Catenulispora acidiphila DSM 44928]|uniref:Putative short chain dehydrogenase n=1 Tax=Catenulispora acidiphila (strain DSM 44928 / JCM 14897 / NBRC 102108 / NRRL B-24433 / ID139908) TaxID=479433 RepID=C7QBA6_CATAD|nr:SDR family oxidoreductase [Catenulispora acidiphila]ACU76397.1 putative short chain dehydrogenase [Catenulispora acidiphila DSM 44928]
MDPEELSRALSALTALPVDDPVRLRVERVAESFVRDGRRRRQKEQRLRRQAADRAVLAASATGAAERREDAPLEVPDDAHRADPDADSVGTLLRPQRCYVCKRHYTRVSAFYHQLCPSCAAENLAWRSARTPLDGRRALVTGGRVKIGFHVALMLLRDGAAVRVATRFPHDAIRRFRQVEDSAKWLDRLTVTGLDLRDPRQVIELCDGLLAEGEPLDILINNAAQTVRRPESSYAPLIAAERSAAAELSGGGGLRELAPIAGYHGAGADAVPHSAELAVAGGAVDENGLLPDPSPHNSWSAEIGELDAVELLEVHLVNAVAPALLADRLLPLMTGSPSARRYIVNVTAVEGRFEVRNKTAGHPHTNMAKAALNMLTRTSAEALARRGVYLSSVDTGWITDEKPMPRKARHAESGFRTPLDIVDGAARIYHPIVSGERGEPLFGVFLKDYRAVAW